MKNQEMKNLLQNINKALDLVKQNQELNEKTLHQLEAWGKEQ